MGTPSYALTIGTGDGTNLAYGLPLFPVIGTARAGISNTSRSNTIVDFDITILFSRTKFHAYYLYLLGVLGPAIAFDIPADVSFSNLPNGTLAAGATLRLQTEFVVHRKPELLF